MSFEVMVVIRNLSSTSRPVRIPTMSLFASSVSLEASLPEVGVLLVDKKRWHLLEVHGCRLLELVKLGEANLLVVACPVSRWHGTLQRGCSFGLGAIPGGRRRMPMRWPRDF